MEAYRLYECMNMTRQPAEFDFSADDVVPKHLTGCNRINPNFAPSDRG
jgi:hypothetical protein